MKKIDALIDRFKEVKEELSKVNGTSPPPPPPPTLGSTATAGGTKTINSQIGNPFGKKEEDGKPNMGHSSFTMEHVNAAVKMPHKQAQQYAHKVVDESTANPSNKAKMKRMIMGSKSSAHLAQGMSNHILAHPSEGLRVTKSEKLSMSKNGQWSLDKLEDSDLPQEDYKEDKDHTAKLLRPHPFSHNQGITTIPAAGRPSESSSAKTKTLDINKADIAKCPKCKSKSCKC